MTQPHCGKSTFEIPLAKVRFHCSVPGVLIVDDEPDILGLLAAAIAKRLGTRVEVAPSGEDAMAKLRGNGYQVVLTDQRMPGMEGTELLQWVMAEHPKCRRILMTAFSGPDLEKKASAAGAHLVLRKPFRLEQLVEDLRRELASA